MYAMSYRTTLHSLGDTGTVDNPYKNGKTNVENNEDRNLVRTWFNDNLIEDGGAYT